MALSLRVTVAGPRISVHEGLAVEVALTNGDARAWELPSLYDQTGALGFELRTRSHDELVTRLDGLTRQAATSSGRLDHTPSLDTLPPGATWSRRFDLARYGAPLRAGEYALVVTFDHPPAGVALRAEPLWVAAEPAPLRAVASVRDNPVLDRQTFLLAAGEEGAPRVFLRQHSACRPLAAWCATPLDLPAGAREPFLASNNRFQSATFDPFFEQWVLWTEGARLVARRHQAGRPAGSVLSAPLPVARRPLGVAYVGEGGWPHVLFEAPGDVLEARALSESSPLSLLFARALPPFTDLVAAADREAVHVVTTHEGLVHHRLTHAGELVGTRQIVPAPRRPWRLALDGCDAVRALLADPPEGRSISLVHADLRTGQVATREVELAEQDRDVREASFARDADGGFHLLLSTGDRRLVFHGGASGPVLVARGEERFFPAVLAGQDLFLGYQVGGETLSFTDHRPRGI